MGTDHTVSIQSKFTDGIGNGGKLSPIASLPFRPAAIAAIAAIAATFTAFSGETRFGIEFGGK